MVLSEVMPPDWYTVPPLSPDLQITSVDYFEPVPDAQAYWEHLHGSTVQDGGWYYKWNGYKPLPPPR